MKWLDGSTDSLNIYLSNYRRQWRTEEPGVLQLTWWQRIGNDLGTEQQQQKYDTGYLSMKLKQNQQQRE